MRARSSTRSIDGREADDVLEAGVPLQVLLQLRHALAQFHDFHKAADLTADALEIERLGDVVFGAALNRVHRGFDGGVAGHDDDSKFRIAPPQFIGQREPAHHGHY